MTDWRHAIAQRLDSLHLPPAREAEVVEEIAQHLDDRYDELRAAGASEDVARRDALAEVDAADLVRELTGVERPAVEPLALGADRKGGPLSGIWQDLRFGFRLLRKDAGPSFVIIFTLSLAIAANAMVFGFADLLLFRPLPIGNANRLVTLYGLDRRQARDRTRLSIPDYLDVKSQCTVCEGVLAMTRGQQMSLTGAGEPVTVGAAYSTANVFRLWDVSAVAGRLLVPGEDDAPGRDNVAVLAHHFWTAHFARDPAAIGRAISLNGRSYTIVGVLTPSIEIGNLAEIDVWVPLQANETSGREGRSNTVMALLKPGATLAGMNTELATISDRLAQAYPATNADWKLFAISLRESTVGASTWIILTLLAIVVALVLVVACANVATVMLARASARKREIAVRVAIGATRSRLVRQLVSEGLLLGLASGALGLLLAHGGLSAFKAFTPETFFERLTINGNLLAFCVTLSVITPMLFGVLPALQSSRPNLNEDLKDGGRDASSSVAGNRSRAVLLVAQVAFALTVLVVSGLIVRSVFGLEHVKLGFNPSGLLTVRLRLDPPKFSDDAARMRAVERLIDRLREVPGVTAVGAARGLPVIEGEPTRQFAISGRPVPTAGQAPWAAEAAVHGDYARAIDLPLLEGRAWRSADSTAAWAVALVNREAVRRYWPGRSPVGERITMLDAKGQPGGSAIEIIGVVDNVLADPTEPAPPRLYRPLPGRSLAAVAFVVRAAAEPAAVAPAVRAALRAEDRDLAVSDARTFETQIAGQLRTFHLIMAMFGGFAAIGLLVAITGIYGVTAFSVGQRRHEIGVRMALGATARDVVGLIAGRTFQLIAIGACVGAAVGWAIGLGMRNVLFGVGAADPATYAGVLALVATCGAIATLVPAYRAIAIDPMTVLKRE